MALTNTPLDPRFTDVVVKDTSVTSTAAASISGSTLTFHSIHITNANNAIEYVKFYDAKTATASNLPDMILMINANGGSGTLVRTINICDGYTFVTALTMRCVATGGTGGTGSPGSAVQVILTLR